MDRQSPLFSSEGSFLLALADAIVIAGTLFAVGYFTLYLDPLTYFIDNGEWVRLIPAIVFCVLGLYLANLYGRTRVSSRFFLVQQIAVGAGVGMLSQAFMAYLLPGLILPHYLTLIGFVATVATLFLWRAAYEMILRRVIGPRTLLFVGTDRTVHEIARHIQEHPELNLRVAGSVTGRPEHGVQPVLGDVAALREVSQKVKPAMIVTGFADSRDRMPITDMLDLRYSGIAIEEAGPVCELICRRVCARDVRPSRAMFTQDFDGQPASLIRAVLDWSAGAFLFVIGAPFALLMALLAKASGTATVFVSEQCAGFRGRPFSSRSMALPGNSLLRSFGRGIHLDAWPQLWNVVTGRMSMVGPRPEKVAVAAALSRIVPLYEYRQNAKPGITGWAQLNLPPDHAVIDSIAEIEYDLYYVRYQALSLYAFILFHGIMQGAV